MECLATRFSFGSLRCVKNIRELEFGTPSKPRDYSIAHVLLRIPLLESAVRHFFSFAPPPFERVERERMTCRIDSQDPLEMLDVHSVLSSPVV